LAFLSTQLVIKKIIPGAEFSLAMIFLKQLFVPTKESIINVKNLMLLANNLGK
tara:strand:- start:304 stop:462 length:159 start_codon:yes stop_codon:yes gene_type:complete